MFAIIGFFNAFLVGNYAYLKLAIIIFFGDFFLRIFINPKYAPSLIAGRILVNNQKPEYVGAPQKKFAWMLGFGMSFIMLIWSVTLDFRGVFSFVMCCTCLSLLFLESACGICVGCKLYPFFTKQAPEHCAGGVCEITIKDEIQNISSLQVIILCVSIIAIMCFYVKIVKESLLFMNEFSSAQRMMLDDLKLLEELGY